MHVRSAYTALAQSSLRMPIAHPYVYVSQPLDFSHKIVKRKEKITDLELSCFFSPFDNLPYSLPARFSFVMLTLFCAGRRNVTESIFIEPDDPFYPYVPSGTQTPLGDDHHLDDPEILCLVVNTNANAPLQYLFTARAESRPPPLRHEEANALQSIYSR